MVVTYAAPQEFSEWWNNNHLEVASWISRNAREFFWFQGGACGGLPVTWIACSEHVMLPLIQDRSSLLLLSGSNCCRNFFPSADGEFLLLSPMKGTRRQEGALKRFREWRWKTGTKELDGVASQDNVQDSLFYANTSPCIPGISSPQRMIWDPWR